jgi:hypothetical protein
LGFVGGFERALSPEDVLERVKARLTRARKGIVVEREVMGVGEGGEIGGHRGDKGAWSSDCAWWFGGADVAVREAARGCSSA